MNHYMDFDPLRDQGALPAGAQGSALPTPPGAVARGARIERIEIRCLRSKRGVRTLVQEVPRAVLAMVT
jgi:hypothetical protein